MDRLLLLVDLITLVNIKKEKWTAKEPTLILIEKKSLVSGQMTVQQSNYSS